MKKEALVKILLSLMQNPSSCPSLRVLTGDDFERLLKIAQLNKATTFLSHFLDCEKCQRKLSRATIIKLNELYTATLARQMIQEREKNILGKIFHQKSLKVMILKDFSSYPKLYSDKIFLASSDIDLLVKKQDFQKVEKIIRGLNYSLGENLLLKNPIDKKTFLYQEKSFIKKEKVLCTNVDLHLQIAVPLTGEFNPLTPEVIREITTKLFRHSRQRKDYFFEAEIEYFFLSLIVHYFSSDLCTCLRNLYDIILLARFYEKKINWEKFLSIAKGLGIQKIALFTILLGSKVFKVPPPASFKKIKLPLTIKMLVVYKTENKIALFPPNTEWNEDELVRNLFLENFFYNLFLTPYVRPTRLLRPRIVLFLFKIAFAFAKEKLSRACFLEGQIFPLWLGGSQSLEDR